MLCVYLYIYIYKQLNLQKYKGHLIIEIWKFAWEKAKSWDVTYIGGFSDHIFKIQSPQLDFDSEG